MPESPWLIAALWIVLTAHLDPQLDILIKQLRLKATYRR